MEEMLKQILESVARVETGQAQLVEGQTQIIKRLDTIDSRLDNINNKLGENNRFTDALSQDMARTVVQVDKINNKINVLNERLFEQEAKLNRLEIVK